MILYHAVSRHKVYLKLKLVIILKFQDHDYHVLDLSFKYVLYPKIYIFRDRLLGNSQSQHGLPKRAR